MSTPVIEVATVWRFGNRRYLTKHAAFMAVAREKMREAHERVSAEDQSIGVHCPCEYCHLGADAEHNAKLLAAELMREAATPRRSGRP